jgi:tetratricopeptide (TPR) repeat protein
MNQSVSAKQLRPLVQGLCKKGKYQDASRIVMGFMEKGYVDYDAADLCARLAREGNNIPLAKTLAELAVKMAPKNWRSWQLSYQAHHADAHWAQALKSLNKIAKLSPSINAEHYWAKAEALERLFRPDEALACLAELDALAEKSAETRMWLLKVNILSQQKRYENVIAVLPPWLETASQDRYVASIWKVLARALDKKGRYEEAFSALTKGNGLQTRLEGIETSTNAVRRRIEVFKSLFTPGWLSLA